MRFRLLANATRKIDTKTGPDGRRRKGKRVPVRPERVLDWLLERAREAGFELDAGSVTVQTGYVGFRHPLLKAANLFAARYDGLLTVTDPARFRAAVQGGIGPAKAFGFGLLTVWPASAAGEQQNS